MFSEDGEIAIAFLEELWPQQSTRMLPRRPVLSKYSVAYQRGYNFAAYLVAKVYSIISSNIPFDQFHDN
jgi:hypothetical protein